jgi:cyclopropane-fatty-acyl-phospholipid synthase
MKALSLPTMPRVYSPNLKWETLVRRLLSSSDVTIGGTRPGDIQVHDARFYRRVLRHGSIGLGESYVDGWWDANQLDDFFTQLLTSRADSANQSQWANWYGTFCSALENRQTRLRAQQNARFHYDIGNDLYEAMLDRRMTYTCAFWKGARDLDTAQENKLERVCRKLQLEPGMHVLDIGCGWGSFAAYAAEKYQVQVTGITVSTSQEELAQKVCGGLPVDIRLQDYRDVPGTYDRVVSLGMFEHVGYKNYRTYMKTVRDRLSSDGICLLQTIGGNVSVRNIDPWINRYIFPSAMLPSVAQIGGAAAGLLIVQDWENFGPDYDKTLLAWFDNFDQAWARLKSRYSERFYRMWKYYLLSCAGSFRSRRNQVWQIVFTPQGRARAYDGYR